VLFRSVFSVVSYSKGSGMKLNGVMTQVLQN